MAIDEDADMIIALLIGAIFLFNLMAFGLLALFPTLFSC